MSGSFPRAGRRFTVGLACILAVTACSGDGDAGEPAAPEPTATVTENPASQAEEAIRTVFEQFMDAVVEAQSGRSDDPAALFEGLATEATIEFNAGIATRYADQGIVRVGEPVITDVNVQVVSSSGVVSACMDESAWSPELVTGEAIPPAEEQLTPHPIVYEVVNADGSWLIGDAIEPGGTITC
ncbi:hypothetical protein E1212_21570 [Jiangella ureilytica]|uniref:Nuclear transport factor 2 family protein n=1 Tax=Jiangella ureilytica TaxID=2530374 RepID=A0A4R4RGA1_9ACTN|nr:hypothetical protein [Jiangella ureilytica]TDC48304.1 hypothetical protein E1212_21570 [Jiangella ureilytica]